MNDSAKRSTLREPVALGALLILAAGLAGCPKPAPSSEPVFGPALAGLWKSAGTTESGRTWMRLGNDGSIRMRSPWTKRAKAFEGRWRLVGNRLLVFPTPPFSQQHLPDSITLEGGRLVLSDAGRARPVVLVRQR